MAAAVSKKQKGLELVVGAKALRAPDLAGLGVSRPAPTDEERAAALENLLTNVLTGGLTAPVCAAARADREILRRLFDRLEREAAYWVRLRYVPAAALADDYTLSYLLKALGRDEISIVTINQILGYFDGLTKRLVFPDEKTGLISKKEGKK
ncbi:MAG: hypothetical protein HQK87_07410 [Nitrospinae bacterium]|nr:hypothetical protein [Nitrospinota bacterium]